MSKITYRIVNEWSTVTESGRIVVMRKAGHDREDTLKHPGSTVRDWVFETEKEARGAIVRAIEKDRAACTRLGLNFETDQMNYLEVADERDRHQG